MKAVYITPAPTEVAVTMTAAEAALLVPFLDESYSMGFGRDVTQAHKAACEPIYQLWEALTRSPKG